jgi:hypothetical protein
LTQYSDAVWYDVFAQRTAELAMVGGVNWVASG